MPKKPPKQVWTPTRLKWMMDEGLPNASTVPEALESFKLKYKLKEVPRRRQFLERFKNQYKVPPSTFLAYKLPKAITPNKADAHLDRLKKENARLQKELEKANDEALNARLIRAELGRIHELKFDPPKWSYKPKSKSKKVFHGTPAAFMSDLHYSEVVTPEAVDNMNKFNIDIAHERIHTFFQNTIYLTKEIMSPCDYPGLYLIFGGDLLAGSIKEELEVSNELHPFLAIPKLTEHLYSGISMLRSEFGRVRIPWVVGNHGRTTRKLRFKDGPIQNYEYMLAHHLAAKFDNDPNVEFVIPNSYTLTFRIHNTRYYLLHGDQFRGGTGISGPILPWALGEHRRRKQTMSMESWSGLDKAFDVLIFGHWHTQHSGQTIIANGSVVGFSEYAKAKNFPYEPPKQSLWFTNPDYGMTFSVPMYLEDPTPRVHDEEIMWYNR